MGSIRGQPGAALFVVAFAIFVDLMVYGLMVPVLPGHASGLGASQGEIGLLLSVYGLAIVVATPVFGVLADRFGSKRPMVFGLLGLAAATLLFAYAPGLEWLVVARILQGFSAAASWVAGLALLANVFPAEERGRAMGMALAGTAAGSLLGPPLGGLLYDWGGFQLPFLVAAGLAALDGLARLLLVAGDETVEPGQPAERFVGSAHSLLTDRVVLLGGVAVLLAAGGKALIEPVLPLHLAGDLGAGSAAIGLLFGASTLAYGVFSTTAGALSDRLGRLTLVGLGLVATGVTAPLLVLAGSLWLVALAMGAFGVAVGFALAPTAPFLADAAERRGVRSYGLVYAFFNVAFAAGLTLGPALSGLLAGALGLTAAMIALGVVLVAFGAALILLARRSGGEKDAVSAGDDGIVEVRKTRPQGRATTRKGEAR